MKNRYLILSILIVVIVEFLLLQVLLPFGIENYDSFELLTAAFKNGVAHAPGYAIFVTLGHLSIKVGAIFGLDPSLSLTLLCNLFALGCLIWVYKIATALGKDPLISIGLLICFSPFLESAVSIEVYSMNLFFCGWSVYLTLTAGKARWRPYLAVLLAGLILSHHLSALPLIALFLWRLLERGHLSFFRLIVFILPAPMIHFASLWIRSSSFENFNPWMDLTHLPTLFGFATASTYREAFMVGVDFEFLMLLAGEFDECFPDGFFIWLCILLLVYWKEMRASMVETAWPFVACLISLIPVLFYQVSDGRVYLLLPYFFLLIGLAPQRPDYRIQGFRLLRSALCALGIMSIVSLQELPQRFKPRAMEQCLKDLHYVHSTQKSPFAVFGYDSLFAAYFAKEVMSSLPRVVPIFASSFYVPAQFQHLRKQALVRHDLKIPNLIGLDGRSLSPVFPQEHILYFGEVLSVLSSKMSVVLPADKEQSFAVLQGLGMSFINRGFWLEVKSGIPWNPIGYMYLSRTIRAGMSGYRLHITFNNYGRIPSSFRVILGQGRNKIQASFQTQGQEQTYIEIPSNFRAGSGVQFELYSEKGATLISVSNNLGLRSRPNSKLAQGGIS